MWIKAYYDVIAVRDIEVPDDADRETAMSYAWDYLEEHMEEIGSDIDSSPIEVRDVMI